MTHPHLNYFGKTQRFLMIKLKALQTWSSEFSNRSWTSMCLRALVYASGFQRYICWLYINWSTTLPQCKCNFYMGNLFNLFSGNFRTFLWFSKSHKNVSICFSLWAVPFENVTQNYEWCKETDQKEMVVNNCHFCFLIKNNIPHCHMAVIRNEWKKISCLPIPTEDLMEKILRDEMTQ